MDELLKSIKTELQSKLSDVRDSDIYITPHLNYVPEKKRKPCIGIKDKKVTRKELVSGWLEFTLQVDVGVYVEVKRDEASIMGDSMKKGAIALAKDLHDILDDNMLDLSGMQSAWSPAEYECELFNSEKSMLIRKIISLQYTREVKR